MSEKEITVDELADVVEGLTLLPTDPSGAMVVLQEVCAARGIR